MPNAGLPMLGKDGASYPLTPEQLASAHDHFTKDFGLALVGGCCGTTPEHLRQVVEKVQGRGLANRRPRPEAGVASLYQHVPFRQDTSFLSIGERTNANGSQAFRRRCSRSAGTTASRSPATRPATAPTCSTSASTTSAATASRT